MGLVLLDRDGVINRDSVHSIRQADDWVPIAGSLEAIAAFHRAGWHVGVCTNQSGIARGLLTEQDLDAIHERLQQAVAATGGRVDGIFVCPHDDKAGCDCRKPAPGLIWQACREMSYGAPGVPFVGDSARDLEAARRAGARPILVRTGNGEAAVAQGEARDCEVFDDLAAVAAALLTAKGD